MSNALVTAAFKGDEDTARRLVQSGKQRVDAVGRVTDDYDTLHMPLTAAIAGGHMDIARWLVDEEDAELFPSDPQPVHMPVVVAAQHGMLDILGWLLRHERFGDGTDQGVVQGAMREAVAAAIRDDHGDAVKLLAAEMPSALVPIASGSLAPLRIDLMA